MQGYLYMEDRGEGARGQRWGTPVTPVAKKQQQQAITPRNLIAVDKAALGIAPDWRERMVLKSTRRKESSVQVVARFRPASIIELEADGDRAFRVCNNRVETSDGTRSWEFDLVFGEECSQEEVYNTAGRPVIDGLLDGYNGTIFAYGQTGSGKTHCMFGPANDLTFLQSNRRGIVPRAAQHVFSHIQNGTDASEFVLRCSLFEVYREQLRDLIDPTSPNLRIKETPRQGVYVEGLAQEFVGCEEDVVRILRTGSRLRAVAATSLNQRSSRSHVIFSLTCEQRLGDGTEKVAKLNLVDLAGSEKVWKSSSCGVTLEEAKKINWSLSALGNVINALAAHQGHVPYRNSKLTRILQETLGGNFKTALVTTCSPLRMHFDETVSSLQFATRAKAVCNHVKVNFVYSAEQLMAFVERLQQEILLVRRSIASRSGTAVPQSLLQEHCCLEEVASAGQAQHNDDTAQQNPICLRWEANLLDESCFDMCASPRDLEKRKIRSGLMTLVEDTKGALQNALVEQESLLVDLAAVRGFGLAQEVFSTCSLTRGGCTSVPGPTLENLKIQQHALHEARKERELIQQLALMSTSRRELEGRRGVLESSARHLESQLSELESWRQVDLQRGDSEARTDAGSSQICSPRDRRPSIGNESIGCMRGELAHALAAVQEEASKREKSRRNSRPKPFKEPSHSSKGSTRINRSTTLTGVMDSDTVEALRHEKEMLELDLEREEQMRNLIFKEDHERCRARMQKIVDKVTYWDHYEDQAASEEKRLKALLDSRRAELVRTQEKINDRRRKVQVKEHYMKSSASLLELQVSATSKCVANEDATMREKCKVVDDAVQELELAGRMVGENDEIRRTAEQRYLATYIKTATGGA
mmetsp:Transcript_12526/g.20636  ORF Transcript_12526/g.20636 Transcript_12526/m.20636 type:complete len:871 (+) Transcript_12526:91-2703(+)